MLSKASLLLYLAKTSSVGAISRQLRPQAIGSSLLSSASVSHRTLSTLPTDEKYLNAAGEMFQKIHGEIKQFHLNGVQNVVIMRNGNLTRWNKIWRNEFANYRTAPTAAASKEYKALKNYSHLVVGLLLVFRTLSLSINGRAEKKVMNHFCSLLNMLNDWEKEYKDINQFPALLQSSRDAIAKILHGRAQLEHSGYNEALKISPTYLAGMKQQLGKFAEEATQLQITSMDNIMKEWDKDIILQAEKTRVLIVVSHAPRDGLIEGQYFKDWFKQRGIDNTKLHVFFVEMLPSQMASIDEQKDLIWGFLAGARADQEIGRYILEDPEAMLKDVLAKYAPKAITELPSKQDAELSVTTVKPKKSGCPFNKM